MEHEQYSRRSRHSNESSESEEEMQLRLLAKRSSKSPVASSPGSRSISYSATVTASYTVADDIHEDRENWVENASPKTPAIRKSAAAPISVSKQRGSPRRATESNKSESRGVRKPSGRIGSTSSPARAVRPVQ